MEKAKASSTLGEREAPLKPVSQPRQHPWPSCYSARNSRRPAATSASSSAPTQPLSITVVAWKGGATIVEQQVYAGLLRNNNLTIHGLSLGGQQRGEESTLAIIGNGFPNYVPVTIEDVGDYSKAADEICVRDAVVFVASKSQAVCQQQQKLMLTLQKKSAATRVLCVAPGSIEAYPDLSGCFGKENNVALNVGVTYEELLNEYEQWRDAPGELLEAKIPIMSGADVGTFVAAFLLDASVVEHFDSVHCAESMSLAEIDEFLNTKGHDGREGITQALLKRNRKAEGDKASSGGGFLISMPGLASKKTFSSSLGFAPTTLQGYINAALLSTECSTSTMQQ